MLHASLPLDEFEHSPDRAEHAERQTIDLQQAQRFEVILLPLDDRAIRHRRILDRHQLVQQMLGNDEAANVLRQMARRADQRFHQPQPARDHWRVGIETLLAQAIRQGFGFVPPGQRIGEPIDLVSADAECAATIANRRLAAIADHRRRQRGPFAPYLL